MAPSDRKSASGESRRPGQLRTRTLCALVGAVWGVFIGISAGLYLAALLLGVSWVFLFGDDPWPEAASWMVPLLATGLGLAACGSCIIASYRFGKAREGTPGEWILRKRAWSLALTALLMVVILAVAVLTGL